MRIDLALKYLCLAKSRSVVRTLCESDAVSINGRPAKPSSTVHPDDRVVLSLRSKTLSVRITRIPQKQLSKTLAPQFYEIESVEAGDE